ncbi:MAG: hypothetical protein ABEN55_03080 [Bradymonadaceae bacterium]
MRADFHGHTLEVRGDWTYRWLYLAPDYELLLDGDRVDLGGGLVVRPRLEAMVDTGDDQPHLIEVELLSIAGLRPRGELSIDGEVVETGRVPVRNVLNPFLVLVIIVSTAIMIYLGPDVLRAYWPAAP